MIKFVSPHTGDEVEILKVPTDFLVSVFEVCLEDSGVKDGLNDEDALDAVKGFVFKSLDQIVSKGYVQVSTDVYNIRKAKILAGLMSVNIGIAKQVESNLVLMLRNIILNDPHGLFPSGASKMVLWSVIYEMSDLRGLVGEGIDPLAKIISDAIKPEKIEA